MRASECVFFFSSRRRHTRCSRDWSSDVCSSDLFVYYGEEIGMTGDKPDERLRTPMQWNGTSRGFTSGKPWEALQPDSLTANVAVEDRASTSLLALYVWLIRLRANDKALREGELEPVDTGNEAVLGYLRKDGSS